MRMSSFSFPKRLRLAMGRLRRADGRGASKGKRYRALFLTCLYTLTLLLATGIAGTAYALTVSPAKIEMTTDPGRTVWGEIELFNEQEGTRTFYTSYENFESRGDSGAPYFTGAKSGLATWVRTQSEVIIDSRERIQVPYTITIPANAKPGGYFAAVFFGSQPAQSTGGGEVTIGGKIGVLVLLKVSGDVDESAGLVDFGSLNNQRFFSTLPVVLEHGFNNTGGDRVVPRGEIKIKNTLQLTSATLLANENEGSVLPNSTRRFEVVWGEKLDENEKRGFFETALLQVKDFHFGWYSAHIELTWGESAQKAEATYNFFIIPWQLFTIILIVLGLVWFSFKVWIARLKRTILAEAIRNKQ